MHNSNPTGSNKEAKTSQLIRIKQEQLNRHLDKVVSGCPSIFKTILMRMRFVSIAESQRALVKSSCD